MVRLTGTGSSDEVDQAPGRVAHDDAASLEIRDECPQLAVVDAHRRSVPVPRDRRATSALVAPGMLTRLPNEHAHAPHDRANLGERVLGLPKGPMPHDRDPTRGSETTPGLGGRAHYDRIS